MTPMVNTEQIGAVMIEKKIGREVRYCRKMVGYTQVAVAWQLGIRQSAVARIERGTQKLTASQAIELRTILGFDLYKLEEGK